MTDEAKRAPLTRGMRRVLFAAAAVVAVGAVIVIWLFASPGAVGPGASPSAGTGTASGSPSGGATQGPVPGATPTAGSEVQTPETGQAQEDPNVLPLLPVTAPLVTQPLPASGAASGEIVKGFPLAIAGPVDGSDVVESSIATEGSAMQVALVARTDAPRADVVAHYTTLWQGLGLSAAPTAEGLAATNPYASLTLAFSSSGTGTVYSVFGVLRSE